MDPAFTEPMEALWFLAGRMNYAGVSDGVAKAYARDLETILERSKNQVVADVCTHNGLTYGKLRQGLADGTKLYAAPPQSRVIDQDLMARLRGLDEDCANLRHDRQVSLKLALLEDLRNHLLADSVREDGA